MNSEINTLFLAIEGDRFAAEVRVASTLDTILWKIDEHASVRQLAKLLDSAPQSHLRSVVGRIEVLSKALFDVHYENPHDTALTAYLRIIDGFDPDLSPILSDMILGARQIWWAHQLGLLIKDRKVSLVKAPHLVTHIRAITKPVGVVFDVNGSAWHRSFSEFADSFNIATYSRHVNFATKPTERANFAGLKATIGYNVVAKRNPKLEVASK